MATDTAPAGLIDGTLVVADNLGQSVIGVDPLTGVQTGVSSGQLFIEPVDLAIEGDGSLIVADTFLHGLCGVAHDV